MTKDNWIKAFIKRFCDAGGPKGECWAKELDESYAPTYDLGPIMDFISQVVKDTEKRKDEECNKKIEALNDVHWWEIRKRCLLYGCVYGHPAIDKKPKKYCEFCGEPNKMIDDDFWCEPLSDLLKEKESV